jgi:hypothetical protein
MKNVAKELYPILFEKKWKDSILFLQDVAVKEEHPFWGSGGAGREFAREILRTDSSWEWLSHRVDDFAVLVERKMRMKLNKWIFRAMLDCGGLATKLCNTEQATTWLMDRYVAELKNLFDTRYKDFIEIESVFIKNYVDGKTNCKRLPSKSKIENVQKVVKQKKEEIVEAECGNTHLSQPSLFDFTNPIKVVT